MSPNIKTLLKEINEDLEKEKVDSMSESDRKLNEVAKKLLLLEREFRTPGQARSSDERVSQLLAAIAKDAF